MTLEALKSEIPSPESDQALRAEPIAPGASLGHRGNLVVRLGQNQAEIAASQALRYHVFYEELAAKADVQALASRRERDPFDDICDHLLVIEGCGSDDIDDAYKVDDGHVVGTYRLLRQEIAESNSGFYTADEFDILPLVESKRHSTSFLELGRSCVLKPYRTKPVLELLWQGIWNYVRLHGLDVMLGCASFPGTDPDLCALPLSFLHHNFEAPEEWRVKALPNRFVDMNRLAPDQIDPRQAMREMPPLIKGYLRLGAFVGDGAVIDQQFNTIDVLIVLPVTSINERYFSYFGAPRNGRSI